MRFEKNKMGWWQQRGTEGPHTFQRKKITLWHVQVKLFAGTWKSCIVQIFYTFCKVKYFDTNTNTHIENPCTLSPCCLWTPCNFFRETASIFLTRRDLQSVLLCRRQNLLVVSLSCTKGGFLSNLDTSPPIFGENSNTFGYNLGNYFWRDQLNDWVHTLIDSSTEWEDQSKNIYLYEDVFLPDRRKTRSKH